MNHTNSANAFSAGVKALPDGVQAFAHTQATWWFLSNPRVSPKDLAVPLLKAARDAVAEQAGDWVLCIHDWSRLNYGGHESKPDRLQMTHERDIGYELQSSLLASATDGAPLAVPAQNLATAQGVWSCREESFSTGGQTHLDEVSDRMLWLEEQQLGKQLVHIIDREADSVAHMRRWSSRGQHWLVRVKGGSSVQLDNHSMSIKKVAEHLVFKQAREVQCKGKPAINWIASTQVVVTRNAKPSKRTPTVSVSHRFPVSHWHCAWW